MQGNYSRAQLYKIADDNYMTLRKYCSILDDEGYWEGPGELLNQSIYEMLDFYVQTVLIRLAVYCGGLNEEQRDFIARVPKTNVLSVSRGEELPAHSMEAASRFFESPPILFQLCGLRDSDKLTGIIGLFFDALMNIQLAMAFLSNAGAKRVTGFIRDYYHRIEVFLYSRETDSHIVNEKYIFLKLCNGVLEKSSEHLRTAGEDFEYYKKTFLYSTAPDLASMEENESHAAKEGIVLEPFDAALPEDETGSEEDGIADEEQENEAENKPEGAKDDSVQEQPKPAEKSRLDELLDELGELIGLDNVKSEIKSLINLIKVRNLRQKQGLPALDMSYHMVFTGSPGTGKTTVARLVAGIYRELGLLSRGTLVETDRSGLVAGYVGQTALKVKEVVERAVGGVLFIDEAYALSGALGTNDFGGEAIETLVKLMEDHRDNLVVIVAGYTNEMKRFLKANTGLMSRFNKFIEFDDYSEDQLIEIMQSISKKTGFEVEEEVCSAIREMIAEMSELKRSEFGNARGIRNTFERMVVNQANRVVAMESPTLEDLTRIKMCDITEL